jgi:hypothetical protein
MRATFSSPATCWTAPDQNATSRTIRRGEGRRRLTVLEVLPRQVGGEAHSADVQRRPDGVEQRAHLLRGEEVDLSSRVVQASAACLLTTLPACALEGLCRYDAVVL